MSETRKRTTRRTSRRLGGCRRALVWGLRIVGSTSAFEMQHTYWHCEGLQEKLPKHQTTAGACCQRRFLKTVGSPFGRRRGFDVGLWRPEDCHRTMHLSREGQHKPLRQPWFCHGSRARGHKGPLSGAGCGCQGVQSQSTIGQDDKTHCQSMLQHRFERTLTSLNNEASCEPVCQTQLYCKKHGELGQAWRNSSASNLRAHLANFSQGRHI